MDSFIEFNLTLATDWAIPIETHAIINADPPIANKGMFCPVTGKKPVQTSIFTLT